MSVFDMFKRNKDLGEEFNDMFDLEFFGLDVEQRLYLKNSAIETNVNLMGRTISTADFRFIKNKKRVDHDFDYLLNVRPNSNQSAAEFWKDFIYTLLVENEVLVVLSDNNDLLIADNFDQVKYALYENVFKSVTVDNYTFKRDFKMSEVIYMTYNNKKFTRFLDDMFTDYTELFSRMVETKMYENQIRALAEIETTQNLDEKNQKRLNNFIQRLYKNFRRSAFAIAPKIKGFNYEEITKGQTTKGQSVEELEKLRKDTTKQVANILGIPSALVLGELSEYETAMKAYIRLTAKPLVEQIKDELNAKLIEKRDYENGLKLKVYGVNEKSPLEMAQDADKLRGSGIADGHELRELIGFEHSDDPIHDKFFITKNYAKTDEAIEGGDENENE
ncbi:phage portal protein [Pseudogracilibacillus auburnensis]|uniref:phage portal protein n=1 Tax=Pseudogracilibacillus auburnensis TaxID=1494959 RepID=UPI001A96EAA5|nr:phage portal protein [Pseudogracilibacillus auburnensis]MBO1005615.1 phage portal protein [Pseudogracilibacillus auburnensis]